MFCLYSLKSLVVLLCSSVFLLICFGGSVSGPKGEMALADGLVPERQTASSVRQLMVEISL